MPEPVDHMQAVAKEEEVRRSCEDGNEVYCADDEQRLGYLGGLVDIQATQRDLLLHRVLPRLELALVDLLVMRCHSGKVGHENRILRTLVAIGEAPRTLADIPKDEVDGRSVNGVSDLRRAFWYEDEAPVLLFLGGASQALLVIDRLLELDDTLVRELHEGCREVRARACRTGGNVVEYGGMVVGGDVAEVLVIKRGTVRAAVGQVCPTSDRRRNE